MLYFYLNIYLESFSQLHLYISCRPYLTQLMKSVILTGGLGIRLSEDTSSHAKPMIEFGVNNVNLPTNKRLQ